MEVEQRLIDAFLNSHPEEAAQTLNGLSGTALVQLLETAQPRAAAYSLQHALPKVAAEALGNMDNTNAVKVLQELPLDAQLVFLHRIEADKRNMMLDGMKEGLARKLRRLLNYPQGSAGNLMDPSPFAIPSTSSVRDAMRHIRKEAQSVRYYIYVIDDDQRLVGVLTLRQLLRAHPRDSVSSLMETNVISIPAMSSERDILKHPRWRDFHGLPVVDRDNVLIGVIRYETLGRLKETSSKNRNEQDVLGTLLALVELYWLGMTGSLDAMSISHGHRDIEIRQEGEKR